MDYMQFCSYALQLVFEDMPFEKTGILGSLWLVY